MVHMHNGLATSLTTLKARFQPGAVKKATTYYLSLGDTAALKWTVTLSPTACEVVAGKTENADCVLKTSAELFLKLINGTWKPGAVDFISGRIKTNDLDLLRSLQTAFGL
jgi:long-chain acyl-CoA synthetase